MYDRIILKCVQFESIFLQARRWVKYLHFWRLTGKKGRLYLSYSLIILSIQFSSRPALTRSISSCETVFTACSVGFPPLHFNLLCQIYWTDLLSLSLIFFYTYFRTNFFVHFELFLYYFSLLFFFICSFLISFLCMINSNMPPLVLELFTVWITVFHWWTLPQDNWLLYHSDTWYL